MNLDLWPIAWAIFGSVCAVLAFRYYSRRPYRVVLVREVNGIKKTIEAEGTTTEEVNAILDVVLADERKRNDVRAPL